MSTNSEQLTEEQEEYLKSLEEEFKDRYTEKEEGYKATLGRRSPSPPVVENWRDFRRDSRRRDGGYRDDHYRDRSRSRDGNWNRGDNERFRYGDRYSHSSRHDYRYREQNHYPNDNRWR